MSPPPDASEAMTPDRWQHVQDVLLDAIDCPLPERSALLDARCTGDPALRAEVESLLRAHESEGLVDQLAPLVKPPVAHPLESSPEWSGRRTAQRSGTKTPSRIVSSLRVARMPSTSQFWSIR